MQNQTLNVTGMTCGGCVTKVANALKAISGVDDVVVSLSTGEVAVRYDEQLTSPNQLESAVKGAGYGLGMAKATSSHQSKGGCCG
ncbi:heavy-metal-associated domain-containing protein [Pseudomonas sp. MH9.2]|uniref:heavy-metal-associated domain-containing protein n=1 Tax=Pseudomonas sp. MH9.2 TaxID=3048629 RepID=UPI002AC93D52|nr:heavy-metal-associated domain-containing protein [Pseudomonas sp. MH9.2]MEB0024787.1 heavy-metal-associated domain-containing protein [Pseudomonas sp. MH9.2]WPX70658.1 heavy-metal-associated domain-containing protein [Pseudomonas sp. MH9.2]